MGCCVGLRNDIYTYKELIVNLSPNQIENYIGTNRNFCDISPKSKYRKHSSKTIETSAESPIKANKRKKSNNFHNHITKEIAKNLKLIAIEEMKNKNKFFAMN